MHSPEAEYVRAKPTTSCTSLVQLQQPVSEKFSSRFTSLEGAC